MTFNAKIYKIDPNTMIINDGGKLNILTGAEINIADGCFTLSGTLVTVGGDELNKLAGAGDVIASGTTGAHIDDPSGGTTEDSEARTAINAILDALEAFGIVQPAS